MTNISQPHRQYSDPAVRSIKVAARIVYHDARILLERHERGSTQGTFTYDIKYYKGNKIKVDVLGGRVARIVTVNVHTKIWTENLKSSFKSYA
jgi:hypothetical protein